MIADATGLNGDTITELVGDKSDLYLKVMEQAYLTLKASQDAAFAAFTHDQAGVRRLADHHLDFCMTHPEVPELWIHRWLGMPPTSREWRPAISNPCSTAWPTSYRIFSPPASISTGRCGP
ncbi:TetR/AcrR family transcriptional regulator [Nonomuraea rubra]|uniref:AcrR family transcriptional regulator n=2 Tax=Nonomuraea rubra TaxID=46180 RepID=A0A7X0NP47_9ACTN|nr:hypothetical protein [Nonomuraea rubra]MBB6547001.1 AcrR family transcriptional regulator [Nonomuraea rubra]